MVRRGLPLRYSLSLSQNDSGLKWTPAGRFFKRGEFNNLLHYDEPMKFFSLSLIPCNFWESQVFVWWFVESVLHLFVGICIFLSDLVLLLKDLDGNGNSWLKLAAILFLCSVFFVAFLWRSIPWTILLSYFLLCNELSR